MIEADHHDPDQVENQLHKSNVEASFGNDCKQTNKITAKTGGSD